MKNKKYTSFTERSLTTSGWQDYELVDSGNNRKLERFGRYQLSRFEPQAKWKPVLSQQQWLQSDAVFHIGKGASSGNWQVSDKMPAQWQIELAGLTLQLSIQKSRHIGIFPEQYESWQWIETQIKAAKRPIKVLNLFGYTGVATLFAARAGAEVTHVDASRAAVKWARSNQTLSGLKDCPIRWIVDDALKFTEREARRGVQYDAIILDPPKFGRGPKGETWKFDQSVQALLQACNNVLSDAPLFVYLTAYDVNYTPDEIGRWAAEIMRPYKGKTEYGEMIQQEKSAGRKISQSMYVRWFK